MSSNLPQYRCHKIVRAAKISAIKASEDGEKWTIDLVVPPDVKGFFSVDVTLEWAVRFRPQIGWYFVVYDDGYQSVSPPQAFESGYSRITEPEEKDGGPNSPSLPTA